MSIKVLYLVVHEFRHRIGREGVSGAHYRWGNPPPTLEYTKQTCQQTQEAGAKHAL